MDFVVSPYHVTTREPPLMAALLLADRVVTMMPSPLTGQDRRHAEAAAGRVPRYLSLLVSWEWTVPLWEAGVLSSAVRGDDPVEDVRTACRRIERDERYAPLRPLMRPGLFDTDEGYLDSISRDLLKGGPDPAICVPVSAAMDRFACRHGLMPLRSEATSVAQRAEERLGERAFALAVPVLLRAGARCLLEARERLKEQLVSLRHAIGAAIREPSPSVNGHARRPDPLSHAARAYAQAFEGCLGDLARINGQADDECRVVPGTVALIGLRLPIDAVLRSSVAAYEAAAGTVGRSAKAPSDRAIVEHDPLDGKTLVSMTVRVLGARR